MLGVLQPAKNCLGRKSPSVV